MIRQCEGKGITFVYYLTIYVNADFCNPAKLIKADCWINNFEIPFYSFDPVIRGICRGL